MLLKCIKITFFGPFPFEWSICWAHPEDCDRGREIDPMAENLFEGLPPPSQQAQERQQRREHEHRCSNSGTTDCESFIPSPAPAPVLKSALKRSEPTELTPQGASIVSSKNPSIL